jgi:hypothetical protein
MKPPRLFRVLRASCLLVVSVLSGGGSALLGLCGPFTDVSDAVFCPFVLEIFTLGITTGTTPTTYSPNGQVSRVQMAAFLSRTVDGVLKRGSRRAFSDRFWTPQNEASLGLTSIPVNPLGVVSDGADLWIAHSGPGLISRVRASDGKLLETWTGATLAHVVLVAMDSVFAAGSSAPGRLYRIAPNQPAGTVTTVATIGDSPAGIAFDGGRIWTADLTSVSVVTPGALPPWSVVTVTTGFTSPNGALFDGANIWVTDFSAASIFKLDSSGAILQAVGVGTGPYYPAFDGTNIWVPNRDADSVTVIRASNGAVLATLTANGLNGPLTAAFDGERVLVTDDSGDAVSLWKAADLTPLGSFSTGAGTDPTGVCSDGANFWVTLYISRRLARF